MELEEQLQVPKDGTLGIQECLRLITDFKQLIILLTKDCPTTCMELEVIMLSEISQAQKDKYCRISLICGV
jgi:hypothetical protein